MPPTTAEHNAARIARLLRELDRRKDPTLMQTWHMCECGRAGRNSSFPCSACIEDEIATLRMDA